MTYLDGTEALYVLLDGAQTMQDGEPMPNPATGTPVPPATTYHTLPADLQNLVSRDQLLIGVSRAGWSDDDKETEGHDRIAVDVYGSSATVVRALSQGIEDFLVDDWHDVPGVGFIDDVRRDSRWRIMPDPTDAYVRSQAVYRLISRPD